MLHWVSQLILYVCFSGLSTGSTFEVRESYLAGQATGIEGGKKLHKTSDLEIFFFCPLHIIAELHRLACFFFFRVHPFKNRWESVNASTKMILGEKPLIILLLHLTSSLSLTPCVSLFKNGERMKLNSPFWFVLLWKPRLKSATYHSHPILYNGIFDKQLWPANSMRPRSPSLGEAQPIMRLKYA